MRIRPLHDRILIEKVEEEEKNTGGIIIPDTAKEKPMQGKVIAVGKDKVTKKGEVTAPDVKEGDRILFSKYAGGPPGRLLHIATRKEDQQYERSSPPS